MASLSDIIARARGETPTVAPAGFALPYPERGACPSCHAQAWWRTPTDRAWRCLGCATPAKFPDIAVMEREGWQMCLTRL